MYKKYFPAFLLLLTILMLTLSSVNCGKQDTQSVITEQDEYQLPAVDTTGAVTGDWILQRELADPQSLNPLTLQDASGREFSYYIFERLMWAADRTSYDVIPWLADSLPQVSEDHLTYIFKLKKNITFSNGRPMTGDDIIFTFKALMNPLVDAAQLRNYVENVKTVELTGGDKYTIKFSLSKTYFRSVVAISDIQILSKEVVDPERLTDKYTWDDCKDMETAKKNPAIVKFADFFNSEDVNRSPKYLIGSGPYIFEKWETGQFVYFKRNPNYWNKDGQFGMAYPEKLVIRVIQDQSAAVVAAKNKEIDLMYVVKPADFVKELANPEQYNLKKADPHEPVFSYIGWNMKSPLFSDKKVRLALSYAVDRSIIIDRIHFGLAVPIQSPVYFEDDKHFNPDLPEIPFDLEKSKQLLKEAGWEDSNGDGILDKVVDGNRIDFKFYFLSNTNVARRQALLVITDALKKIGIISDVQDLEWSVFLQKLKKHEFDAFMGAWVITDYPPDEYQLFHSSQMKSEGSNYVSYSNPEADKLMEDYRIEFDENKRAEMIKKLQKIFYDDQVYTFLWTPNAKYVYSDRYKNVRWYPTPITAYQTSEWWVPVNSRKYHSAN